VERRAGSKERRGSREWGVRRWRARKVESEGDGG